MWSKSAVRLLLEGIKIRFYTDGGWGKREIAKDKLMILVPNPSFLAKYGVTSRYSKTQGFWENNKATNGPMALIGRVIRSWRTDDSRGRGGGKFCSGWTVPLRSLFFHIPSLSQTVLPIGFGGHLHPLPGSRL